MGLCQGCGRVLSSYALLIACVQNELSVVSVDVMCAVYCATPECVCVWGVLSGNFSLEGLDGFYIGVLPPSAGN